MPSITFETFTPRTPSSMMFEEEESVLQWETPVQISLPDAPLLSPQSSTSSTSNLDSPDPNTPSTSLSLLSVRKRFSCSSTSDLEADANLPDISDSLLPAEIAQVGETFSPVCGNKRIRLDEDETENQQSNNAKLVDLPVEDHAVSTDLDEFGRVAQEQAAFNEVLRSDLDIFNETDTDLGTLLGEILQDDPQVETAGKQKVNDRTVAPKPNGNMPKPKVTLVRYDQDKFSFANTPNMEAIAAYDVANYQEFVDQASNASTLCGRPSKHQPEGCNSVYCRWQGCGLQHSCQEGARNCERRHCASQRSNHVCRMHNCMDENTQMPKTFTKETGLLKHFNEIHCELLFMCRKCGDLNARPDRLRAHLQIKHQVTYNAEEWYVIINTHLRHLPAALPDIDFA